MLNILDVLFVQLEARQAVLEQGRDPLAVHVYPAQDTIGGRAEASQVLQFSVA